MSQDLPTKKYPTATEEVAKMLGMHSSGQQPPASDAIASHGDLPIANLPVAPSQPPVNDAHAEHPHTETAAELGHTDEPAIGAQTQSKALKVAKAAGPYVAVFAIGLVLYYFFFSTVNFNSVFQSAPKVSTPSENALQQLEAADSTSYQNWIMGYYYDVSDLKVLDPESDNSGNGLSNFQKYLLGLNPKAYDTLGLGQADSQTLASGIDPSTGLPLSNEKKAIIAKYIDMEVVMNRLSLNEAQHPQAVAGVAVNSNGTPVNTASAGLNTVSNNSQVQEVAPVTGADLGNNSVSADGITINTNIPGRLEIPDLKLSVPIIWTKDTNDFDTDLESGVVHYPGTAMPGEIGTSYIAGHSSNYVWAKGDYNHVFTHLGDLAVNTSFQITVVQTNGQNAIFHYVVTGSQQYLPTDQAQFADTGKSVVALSTCWPVNSTAKRLVVFGQLTQVEK